MAHGFNSYTQPKYGNLSAYIGGKIKDAAMMAGQERVSRQEEVEQLQKKYDAGKASQEEIVRLDSLKNQESARTKKGFKSRIKNSFFTKAVMSEFGGDRLRRTKGYLSSDPDETKDPSLTKEQRFSAVLNRGMSPAPMDPPPAPDPGQADDIRPEEYGAPEGAVPPQQPLLEKLIDRVKSSYEIINARVGSLGSTERKSIEVDQKKTDKMAAIISTLHGLKEYFKKDNELKIVENTIEQEKLDLNREQINDAEMQAKADQLSQTFDGSGQEDQLEPEGGGQKKGLLGSIMDGVGGLFKNFMGKGGKTKGVMPQGKAYSSPIGPQPMNSSTPWAKMGAGDRGGMFGGGQFTPRMAATKLSEGGIVDNPTVTNLNPGDSVIPLNRNNAVANVFKGAGQAGGELADPMTQVMQLPTKVGGGLLVSLLAQVANKLGGLSGLLKPLLSGLAKPIASMFGLPATIISTMLGGAPAAAATMGDGLDISKLLGGTGLKIPGMSSPKGTPGAGPAAAPNLAGTGVVNEVSGSGLLLSASQGGHAEVGVTSKFGNRESPGGVGSTNHQGVDIGTSGQKGYKVAFKRGGTVTHAGTAGGFGNLVIIKDEDGTEYYFGHLANINPDIKVGAEYTGQTIGEIGNTGTGTGEHLHFEKHPNGGAAVDPINDIGLLSIGKQTQALPTTDAPVVDLANLNKPEPQTPSIDTSGLEESGPALAALIKANQKAQQQQEQPELTVPGLSGLPIYDPTRLDSSYLFAF